MLAVKDLSVELNGAEILNGVSFEASPGEVAGIAGPNGGGKSTLMRAILGLAPKKSGTVTYLEVDVTNLKPAKRARIFSHVPQGASFLSLYTVLECVVMGRYSRLGRFESYGADDFSAAKDAIARVGLSGFENRIVSTLSGGETARVACARAIAQDSPVMLLDEPTSALDPRHAVEISTLLRQLAAEGKIILVSMHDINLAINYTDRLILVKNGRVYGTSRSCLVDEKILTGLYDIPWEIWRVSDGEKIAAIPLDHSSSNINPLIS
jgi:iron complex transport system ATP-binding protein